MRSKRAVIGLSVLAVFALACGVGSGQTGSSAGGGSQATTDGAEPIPGGSDGGGAPAEGGPVTVAMGQTVTLTNTVVDTTTVEVTLADPQQDQGGEFLGPQNGLYYAVMVTIVCTEGSYTANPGGFKFVGADGTVYDWTITGAFEPTLSFTELNAGQRVSGYVVFDIAPAAVAGGKIQMDGIGLDFDEAAAYWTV